MLIDCEYSCGLSSNSCCVVCGNGCRSLMSLENSIALICFAGGCGCNHYRSQTLPT